MRNIRIIFIIFIVLIIACNKSQSQNPKPEKVHRIVYEMQSDEWYNEQAELWKKELDKNPQNPEAWVNYYNANRYAQFDKIGNTEKKQKLAKIIAEMEKAIPATYECYVLKYRNTNDIWDISLLEKAYRLNPTKNDIYDCFITHYEVTGDEQKVTEFYNKFYDSNDIAPWLINYNYNVLMSTAKNAILFTNGDNDTYPARMLQEVKSIRTDVTVINIPLSAIDSYLKRKLSQKDIKIDIEALKQRAKLKTGFSIHEYVQKFCKLIAENYPEYPIYFALTVQPQHIEKIKDNLYIVGLAFQYSKNRFDNVDLIKKNLETKFRMDYLLYDWYHENYIGERIQTRMNLNYVAPIIMLAEHYKNTGMNDQVEKWKKWAIFFAEKAGDKRVLEELENKKL